MIVVVGYWEVQARGESYRKKPRIYLDDDYDGSGLAYNKVSFQHGLQRLVDAFPDRRFIIVEDVPVGLKFRYAFRAMHIQNVLGRGLAWPELINIGISRQEYERQLASYRPILTAVARSPNVSIVPLIDQLCDSQLCSGTRNGALLFRDGDHLSMAGGLSLTDTFFRAFTQRVEAKTTLIVRCTRKRPRSRGGQLARLETTPLDRRLLVGRDGRGLCRPPCAYRPKVKSRSLASRQI